MTLQFREAIEGDIPYLVQMLADDELGAKREDTSKAGHSFYLSTFVSIQEDPNNELLVAETEGIIVGMLQLTFIPYLTHKGSWRCLIEGVRVHARYRRQGYGEQFFVWAIERAQQRQCKMVQLTSDKQRPDALKFYEKLGFKATHEGFKYML